MTKAELIAAMAKDGKCSKTLAEKLLNSFTSQVTRLLKRNGKITLTGFGAFSVAKRKARKGRNPQTGDSIQIKSCHVPKFRPGKELKEAVLGNK